MTLCSISTVSNARKVSARKHDDAPGRFTWFDYRDASWERKHGMRIDYVYATAPLYERCTKVVHDWEPREWDNPSDHVPVVASFA
jgi:exodeoxyribonuclease-3